MNRRDLFKFLAGIGLGAVTIETYERLYHIPMLETMFRKELEYWVNQYNIAREEVERLTGKLRKREDEISSLRSDLTRSKEELEHLIQQYNTTREEVSRLSEKLEQSVEEINNLKEKASYWEARYNTTREEIGRLNSIINKIDDLERESTSAIAYYRGRMDEAIRKLKEIIERYRVLLGDERISFESSTVKILEDLKLTQEKLQKVLPYFPLILNFSWKPTKVVNDKIYSIKVIFEVISPLSSLEEVEVMLIPVEYRYFITKYGMREEDYDKVFPEEEVRSVKIKPMNLEREMFSVDFEDLKGGREYIIKARVEDVGGSEKMVEVKTPYIRQFENLGKELYKKGIIVATSYMPRYYPWQEGRTPDDYPLLGRYNSLDDILQWKHIDWANGYGINVFLIDGGSWEDWKIKEYEGILISSLMNKGMKCGIQWGPWKDFIRGTIQGAPEWSIDLSLDYNKNLFLSHMKRIANWNIFDHNNYFKIDGRPSIFFYDATAFINERAAFEEMRSIFKEKNFNICVIADSTLKIPFTPSDSSWYLKYKDFPYDVLTTWAGFVDANVLNNTIYIENYNKFYEDLSREWSRFAIEKGMYFMYSLIPGFKYIDRSEAIPRDLGKFKERFLYIIGLQQNQRFLVRIDTWNDFGENSHIEPSINEGFSYLNILKETLKTYNI
jgi:plasmid maintenance system antidote protein VapI